MATPKGAGQTAPFSKFEWMIAWRYLRAKRAEGGVSVMTWISLLGITLAVFAMLATLAVRSGFRTELVDTILGANAHVTVYSETYQTETGQRTNVIPDYEEMAERVRAVPGVTRVAPLVRGKIIASHTGRNAPIDVYGITTENLQTIPRIAVPEESLGSIDAFEAGIAIGWGVARNLGVTVGDRIRIISPDGARTAFGTSPRVSAYEVVYIFKAGRFDIDEVRVYLPFAEAQSFFNREGVADELEVMVEDPEAINDLNLAILRAAGDRAILWTWLDRSGAYLNTLRIEDNVMFILMSILVLIAAMNIISGLIMLVKNKGRDIGILRTMGLTQGSILRVFFLSGALVGTVATVLGVILGVLFVWQIDAIFQLVDRLSGGGAWEPSSRGLYQLPARLEWDDVLLSTGLSLGLSWFATLFPARRAARMNPVEALRYE